MNIFEIVIYPFLFAAVYFQAFLLVTFLSSPARKARMRPHSSATPNVAIIVPCYNEETTVAGTVESLLALTYPKDKLRIILVNDGSTDGTKAAMDAYQGNPHITVLHTENGGKHTALNKGIALASDCAIVGCLDADSFVEPSALSEMIPYFSEEKVAAVTAAMSIHRPKRFIEHMQNAEYILGIALRHILAAVNGLYVTPGPLSLYRRDVVVKLGGFRFGHQTEDMEMALRLQREGYVIDNAPKARVYTKGMSSIPALVKQRTRWTSGFLRNMTHDYRDLVGNPRYGTLGLIVLPLGILAIAGGLITFIITLYTLVRNVIKTYVLASGVPIHFTFSSFIPSVTTFQWFYVPFSMFATLTLIAGLGVVIFTILGKRISETPGQIGIGVIAYLIAYGVVAPFWLMRAVADVASGKKRSWK